MIVALTGPRINVRGKAQLYRPDIDGLRAIAVLSVFAFHLYPDSCPGGFVGVDVFFVISGFLISRIIISEVDEGRFSFVGFYERRVRRIAPALIGLLVGTAVGAAVLLPPSEFVSFGNSARAAVLSISNFYFWKHTGYFELGSNALPLLHTWSLGVEEQFYAAFPLIFALGRRLRLSWAAIILPLGVLSLGACVLQTRIDPTGAFYSPLTRAWEFLAGALLAAGVLPTLSGRRAEWAVLAGLVLLGVSFAVIDDSSSFPGWRAVLPVSASAALIAGGSGARLAAPLRAPVSVSVGRVSYSLYLWHWPVIVAARIFWGGTFSLPEAATVVTLSGGLAYLSWRFIEEPPRRRRRLFTRQRLFVGAAASAVAIGGISFVLVGAHGFPGRYTSAALAFLVDEPYTAPRGCSVTLDACVAGERGIAPTIAVIGDSMALHLLPGVDRAATARGRSVLYFATGGCLPLLGVGDAKCRRFVSNSVAQVAADQTIKRVLLIGRWTTAVEPRRFGRQNTRTDQIAVPALLEAVDKTRSALGERDLMILGNIPEQPVDVPTAEADQANLHLAPFRGVSVAAFQQRVARTDALLERAVPSALWIDAARPLCGAATCDATLGGRSLYSDDNHLSTLGANYVAQRGLFDPLFSGSPAGPVRNKIQASAARTVISLSRLR